MPTVATAAVTAATFVALYAGHQLGDHPVQRGADAAAKGAPAGGAAAPWTGWAACLRHVATYSLTQAAALALVAVAAPLTWSGVVAALVVSAATHAVIDRRWIVRSIIRAKGCADWAEGPYLIDQSLHMGALLLASVLAAVTAGAAAVGVVVAAALAVVGAGLAVERRVAGAWV